MPVRFLRVKIGSRAAPDIQKKARDIGPLCLSIRPKRVSTTSIHSRDTFRWRPARLDADTRLWRAPDTAQSSARLSSKKIGFVGGYNLYI